MGQFGVLYWAMQRDITPGMASLLVQSQVFFTILMSMAFTGERMRLWQALALVLAVAGYAVVAWYSVADPGAAITLLGVGLVLLAGLSWACANMVARTAGRVNMVGFIAWSSLFAVPPSCSSAFWPRGLLPSPRP